MKNKPRIIIVGSGNVAWHLTHAFMQCKEVDFKGFFSRNTMASKELHQASKAHYFTDYQSLAQQADCFIICASDDAIEQIANQLPADNAIIAHTSGVVSMQVLKNASANYGSFYPLQTFTKNRAVELQNVPFLIDGSNKKTQIFLYELAQLLSNNLSYLEDAKRRELHVAAVIVNNFSNHLFALAKDYTDEMNLDFNLLKPLILETAKKATEQNPKDIQTGPAKRKDKQTIEQHLSYLKDEKLKELYTWFTESIEKFYK